MVACDSWAQDLSYVQASLHHSKSPIKFQQSLTHCSLKQGKITSLDIDPYLKTWVEDVSKDFPEGSPAEIVFRDGLGTRACKGLWRFSRLYSGFRTITRFLT